MKLLDKSFDNHEKENTLLLLDGCICRICVSDNPLEIIRMVGFANRYISMLAQNRILQLKEKEIK